MKVAFEKLMLWSSLKTTFFVFNSRRRDTNIFEIVIINLLFLYFHRD